MSVSADEYLSHMQPDNIFEFSANYFAEKREARDVDAPISKQKNAQAAAIESAFTEAQRAGDFASMSEALHGAPAHFAQPATTPHSVRLFTSFPRI